MILKLGGKFNLTAFFVSGRYLSSDIFYLTNNNIVMKKILLILVVASLVGCTTHKVSHTTFKREYKENRFTKQFHQADSMFNEKYLLK